MRGSREKGAGMPGPPSPDPVSNTKQRQSSRPLYTLGLKTRCTTKHAQVTCSRWTSAVLKERVRYYVTALSWQPMGFLVMLCKIARSFAGWDPRDTMLLVLKNSCQTGKF